MHTTTIIAIAFNVLPVLSGSVGCKRNACYNIVAGQVSSPQSVAVRKADCQGVLQPVIAPAVTLTIASATTVFPATVTVTTQIGSDGAGKRSAQVTASPDSVERAGLVPRAQLNWKGRMPAYANTCKVLENYASACLCFGFKASTIYPTKTVSTVNVVSATATATVGFDFISYLKANGQEFCTSYIGYAAPQTTTTAVNNVAATLRVSTGVTFVTSTTVATQKVTATQVLPGPVWRRGFTNLRNRVLHVERDAPVAVPTPSRIATWQAADISSACSLIATGLGSTSISVTTVYATTATDTSTFTSMVSLTATEITSTSTTSYTPGPTQLAGSLAGAPKDLDASWGPIKMINFPWNVQLLGQYGSGLCVLIDGTVRLGYCDNTKEVRAFQAPLAIRQGKAQGIDYELRGTYPDRTARIRWYVSLLADQTKLYNFSMIFFEDNVKQTQVLFEYYNMADNGVAGRSELYSPSSPATQLSYSVNQAKLTPKKWVWLTDKTMQIKEGLQPYIY